jgi:hypothetical protein
MGHRDRERVRVREDHQVIVMQVRFGSAFVLTAAASTAPIAVCRAQSTQPARTDSTTAVVSSVQIHRENVFDKAESGSWLFAAANKLHIVTREHVVRRELLIPVGAPFDSATADETARNLRKLGIFRKATVDSSRTSSGLAENVTTHDSWTTQVQAAFKSSGDQITWNVGVAEKNLLGRQIKASVKYTSDPDRSTTQFAAFVPRVWRNRVDLSTAYKQYSDGESGDFSLSAPFTTLTTPRSSTLDVDYADRNVLRFFEGEEEASDTLRHLLTKGTLTGAWAIRASRQGYVRVGAKLQLRRENFADLGTPIDERSFFGELGTGVEWSRSNFSVVEGYRGLGGPEDIDLSATVRGDLWVAPSAWGYERGGVGPAVKANVGKLLPNGFTTLNLRASSLFTSKGLDSGSVAAQGVLTLLPAPRHTVVFNAQGGMQKNPYPGEEYDLGLTFGPRAYPAHAFTGDRAFFTTVEYRWVAFPEVYKLLGIGLATYVDYGGAWYSGSPVRTGADAGVGLRLGSTRAASGKGATRVDLSWRFASEEFDKRWILSIGTGFPFDIAR